MGQGYPALDQYHGIPVRFCIVSNTGVVTMAKQTQDAKGPGASSPCTACMGSTELPRVERRGARREVRSWPPSQTSLTQIPLLSFIECCIQCHDDIADLLFSSWCWPCLPCSLGPCPQVDLPGMAPGWKKRCSQHHSKATDAA